MIKVYYHEWYITLDTRSSKRINNKSHHKTLNMKQVHMFDTATTSDGNHKAINSKAVSLQIWNHLKEPKFQKEIYQITSKSSELWTTNWKCKHHQNLQQLFYRNSRNRSRQFETTTTEKRYHKIVNSEVILPPTWYQPNAKNHKKKQHKTTLKSSEKKIYIIMNIWKQWQHHFSMIKFTRLKKPQNWKEIKNSKPEKWYHCKHSITQKRKSRKMSNIKSHHYVLYGEQKN